jgi:ABC-type transport system involved in multi-copper enzyme maturation permease subunit
MSNPSQISTLEPATTEQASNSTVFFGNMNYFSVLGRSIASELYKIRRRTMSKVLSIIAIVIIMLSFIALSIPAFSAAAHGEDLTAPQTISMPQSIGSAWAQIIRLPESLYFAGSIAQYIGTILLIILAGAIVGSEYASGTIRIMLTRGPTRVQFLFAKIGTMLICTVVSLLTLLLIGVLTGTILNLLLKIPTDLSLLTSNWYLHAALYILTIALDLFTYTLLAIALSTLGKSTAAGVAGAILWWFLEGVLSNIINSLSNLASGPFAEFLKAIPTYFPGNNLAALVGNQAADMSGSAPGSIGDIHAILVVIIYWVVFIGVACWVLQARDITN